MDVAFSLGIYFAERNKGPFADSVISFSENPKYITLKGNLWDKVQKLWHSSEVANTNIEKTFDLLLKTALQPNVKKEDIPENVLIISDMEFDEGTSSDFDEYDTLFNNIKAKWAKHGLTMPHCIFWNVDARQNNLPMKDEGNVSFVSGFSPSIFKAIITGKKGYELMMEALANPAFRELTNTIQEYYKD